MKTILKGFQLFYIKYLTIKNIEGTSKKFIVLSTYNF